MPVLAVRLRSLVFPPRAPLCEGRRMPRACRRRLLRLVYRAWAVVVCEVPLGDS